MSILQTTKKAVEQVTGAARPGRQEVADLLRPHKPNVFRFRDDGLVPKQARTGRARSSSELSAAYFRSPSMCNLGSR